MVCCPYFSELKQKGPNNLFPERLSRPLALTQERKNNVKRFTIFTLSFVESQTFIRKNSSSRMQLALTFQKEVPMGCISLKVTGVLAWAVFAVFLYLVFH
jgi:hypothetical protein